MTEAEARRQVTELAGEAKEASRRVARAPTPVKNAVLADVAARLRGEEGTRVLDANARDVEAAKQRDLPRAMVDRLRLDPGRLDKVAAGLEQVASLPDPVGEVTEMRRLPNGLHAGRMRVPLGLVGIIYESRPDVTVDAAALCLKSGNAVLLRGGSEAFQSNTALAELFGAALREQGLPPAAAALVPTTDRAATHAMLELEDTVDLIIPRGGEALIRFVAQSSRVPVVKHYKGVCHVYIDGDADPEMALSIAMNAKTQRAGVCNAMETLLVDRACAEQVLPRVAASMKEAGVELRGDDAARAIVSDISAASGEDWSEEFLDLVLAVAVVDGIDGAMAHIARYGSNHTEAIVTGDYTKARRWVHEVDASLTLVNASTRFNDGFQLGLGAEVGISTTKLHAYGPMGLAELCALKWIAYGDGQIRT